MFQQAIGSSATDWQHQFQQLQTEVEKANDHSPNRFALWLNKGGLLSEFKTDLERPFCRCTHGFSHYDACIYRVRRLFQQVTHPILKLLGIGQPTGKDAGFLFCVRIILSRRGGCSFQRAVKAMLGDFCRTGSLAKRVNISDLYRHFAPKIRAFQLKCKFAKGPTGIILGHGDSLQTGNNFEFLKTQHRFSFLGLVLWDASPCGEVTHPILKLLDIGQPTGKPEQPTLILTCIKTGTWWRVSSPSEAMRTARDNGLVDFEFGAET